MNGSEPILYTCITIDVMLNFNGDFDAKAYVHVNKV